MRISHSTGLVAALTAALVLGQAFGTGAVGPTRVHAQCPAGSEMLCNRVGADGKGILAGGILGAEIGFLSAAIIVSALSYEDRQSIDQWWWYTLWGVAFAAGGAVGGYFALEDPATVDPMTMEVTQQGFPEVAVALLAVGIAAIVPTFVGVLALTAYSPGADDGGQGASGDEDATEDDDDGGGGEESSEQSAMQRMLAGGPGLLRFDRGQLLLGIPMVHSAQTFTPEEQQHMGLAGSQDLRVPLFSGVF